ncbi:MULTISPECIES: siderophore-iron reductase FhuF [unclassified Tatumella]|uniref:siderophore-iron reductase FhuF n=1 Tax=unclassified Tatumella TaxID=2649542 RepID=UPI001BB05ACA|nr:MULTISPECIES: siderophore-iron reductase FhuF [unclassified Tatumella]MBS0876137.1 siderophore-iron reductase FhuF [Tatumella sp. JGM82]MBS0889185.1 siderophore-iron reductase FhuF [Tatumella sp. JGM94]MBS0901067.1 siderophore-iron reductase FhuF [Tatumella sp. JGM100]
MSVTDTTAELPFSGVPARILCQPDAFGAWLPSVWQQYSPSEKAAWLSLWSHWLFADTLINWAVRLCCEQRASPLWEFNGQLQLNHHGYPETWLNAGAPGPQLPLDRQQQQLEQLISQFIDPVCQTLATFAGHNLTVFWSNAAVRLWQGMQRAAEKQADVQLLEALFAMPRLPDGQVNRLYAPLRTLSGPDGSPRQQRRHCCLIFRLDGHQKCPSCPLLKSENS